MKKKLSRHRICSYAVYKYEKFLEFILEKFSQIIKITFFEIALIFLELHATFSTKKAEPQNSKSKILVVRNKFYSKSSLQNSTEYYQIDKTIEQSGFEKPESIFYQSFGISPICDIQFYVHCVKLVPSIVVFSSWGARPNHPDPKIIGLLSKKFGIKFIAIWWDTCSRNFERQVRRYADAVSLNVVIDNPRLLHINRLSKFMSMWAPQDDELFKPSRNKDIDVSFMGQIGDYRSYRATSIYHLKKSGIKGIFSTEDRSAQVTHENYASIMGRSKIVINFSQSVHGHQSKGRVMEAIRSGALLLESENNQTSELFVPNKHYINFVDEHDLLEKVRYYLLNEDERSKIAAAARTYLIENYSNRQFWSKVLSFDPSGVVNNKQ